MFYGLALLFVVMFFFFLLSLWSPRLGKRELVYMFRKIPKYSDTQKFAIITLKFEQDGFTKEYAPKRCSRNCKQYRPWSGAVWSGSALFAQTYLSENLGSLW